MCLLLKLSWLTAVEDCRGTEDHDGDKNGQKVEKKCSEWTAGGLEHQDGAGRS